MSQRLGMADGRSFTINNSSKLYDNFIKTQNGIKFEDNYSFRKLLQDPLFIRISLPKMTAPRVACPTLLSTFLTSTELK